MDTNTNLLLEGIQAIFKLNTDCPDSPDTCRSIAQAGIDPSQYCQSHLYGPCECRSPAHGRAEGCTLATAMRRIDRDESYIQQQGLKIGWENHAVMCDHSTFDVYINFQVYGVDADSVNRASRKQCDIRAMKDAFDRGEITIPYDCWQPHDWDVT